MGGGSVTCANDSDGLQGLAYWVRQFNWFTFKCEKVHDYTSLGEKKWKEEKHDASFRFKSHQLNERMVHVA